MAYLYYNQQKRGICSFPLSIINFLGNSHVYHPTYDKTDLGDLPRLFSRLFFRFIISGFSWHYRPLKPF